jgi:hypothetical protein
MVVTIIANVLFRWKLIIFHSIYYFKKNGLFIILFQKYKSKKSGKNKKKWIFASSINI